MPAMQDGKGTVTPVSKDTSANSVANPIGVQISQDGTNAVSGTYPLPVSKDANANATGNRIWVTANQDQVSGTTVSVNSGTLDAGTQRVTIATNDNLSSATTTDGGTVASRLVAIGGTDGSNAQMLYMDSTGRPYVNRNWTVAGESVPDGWTAVQTKSHFTYVQTGSATVDASDHLVMDTVNVANYKHVSITIYNNGADLTNSIVYVSNDDALGATNWVSLVPVYGTLETTARTLVSGSSAIAFYSVDFAFKYIKYHASCGTSTSLTYYLFCRA